jgi:PBP1b-binding outer membrane lipoprotein LpoB
MHRIWVTGILGSALLLGGCVFAPGDSRDWDDKRSEPTIGQQLIDLDRARNNGIITNAEYEQTKAKVLDSVR